MSFGTTRRESGAPPTAFIAAIVTAILIGGLYWARAIIIPLALAIFLTFILSPSVTRLRRFGLSRVPAVLIVVGATVIIVALFGWLLSAQINGLVQEMPEQPEKIRAKLNTILAWTAPDSTGKLGKVMKEFAAVLESPARNREAGGPEPTPVVIVSRTPGWLYGMESAIGPIAEVLGQAFLTFILAVFLLLNREDMRNRILRLIGPRQLTATTKAMDDAATRISRFLRMQLLINASFGVALSIIFLLIGVRYAILWGFFAALMRYVPYIGAWIGLIPPVVVTVALTDTWWPPVAVVTVYAALELVISNVMEPRLLGHSLGMSEVAQIFSAAFWAFLWGPIGLVLSGPLSACLLVLGKNVPQLRFFAVLLGVEEPLTPDVMFYQRLVARDREEAGQIAADYAAANGSDGARDTLLIPALGRAQQTVANGDMSEDVAGFVVDAVREIADEMEELPSEQDLGADTTAPPVRVPLVVVPAAGPGDVLALQWLVARLNPQQWDVRQVAGNGLASDLLAAVNEHEPAAVIVAALPPGGRTHARYLCKRLRARHPELKLLVGRWGRGNVSASIQEELRAAGADEVAGDLPTTVQLLQSWWSTLVAANSLQDKAAEPPTDRSRPAAAAI